MAVLGSVGIVFTLSSLARATCKTPEESEVCQPRDIYFMPGVEGIFYAPKGASDPFLGGGVQFAPYHWSHNNDNFGPSQGAAYMEAAILQSKSQSSSLALFDAGFSLSLERNASRNYLIPYFGANVGGTISTDLPKTGFAYPFAGVHLLWHQNLVLAAEGGYHFPFQNVDEMRGPRVQFTARFSMW